MIKSDSTCCLCSRSSLCSHPPLCVLHASQIKEVCQAVPLHHLFPTITLTLINTLPDLWHPSAHPSPSARPSSLPYPHPMDRFLAPHSPEAQAHSLVTFVLILMSNPNKQLISFHSENTVSWDMEHPSLNETLIAGCASYQALSRYLTGADLVFFPRTRKELQNVL